MPNTDGSARCRGKGCRDAARLALVPFHTSRCELPSDLPTGKTVPPPRQDAASRRTPARNCLIVIDTYSPRVPLKNPEKRSRPGVGHGKILVQSSIARRRGPWISSRGSHVAAQEGTETASATSARGGVDPACSKDSQPSFLRSLIESRRRLCRSRAAATMIP